MACFRRLRPFFALSEGYIDLRAQVDWLAKSVVIMNRLEETRRSRVYRQHEDRAGGYDSFLCRCVDYW